MVFDEFTLENGLRVVAERIPHFRSVSVGLWIGSGSQYETVEENGISHFIEHMQFKGTLRRSARQIAEEMDAVGGQINAFTAKECTCFYAKVVDEHFELALDMLADINLNSAFDSAEIEKEKGVVIEEIRMAEDTPEDLVHEMLMTAKFGDQPIARPILGNEGTVSALTREKILGYWERFYRPENAVLAVAGNYDLNTLKALSEKLLGGWQKGSFLKPDSATRNVEPAVLRREKDIEQLHICLGYPGVLQDSDKLYPLSIFNSVFGGAMSSRLFQKIREERGMAYTVYSYPSAYLDCGLFTIYAGTSIEHAPEVLRLIREESELMIKNGMSKEEFAQAREQLKGGYILGLESTSSRMNAIGRRKLLLGNTQTETEVIERINAITQEQVEKITKDVLSSKCAVSFVGKGADSLTV